MRRLLLFVLLGTAAVIVPAHAATKQVAIRGSAYQPPATTIAPGDTVRWTNHDQVNHTVTGDNDLTFRSNTMGQDDPYEKTFPTAGSFPYHCDFHPDTMKGTVTVQAGGGGTTTSSSSTTTTTRPPSTTTTTRRTTTTAAAGQSSVTAPGETTTTTSTTTPGETTTTTLAGDTTTTTEESLAASAADDEGDDSDPSHAGPAAAAALLLAAVSGGAALAVKRGLL